MNIVKEYCKDELRKGCPNFQKTDCFGDTCHAYQVYYQGITDGIEEYSSKLWQVIEKATVNCKLDFNINDLHNLEIIIKGLAEEIKEQKNE